MSQHSNADAIMELDPPKPSILIINPNSTVSMTEALEPVVDALGFNDVTVAYLTAPTGPASINNHADALESQYAVMPMLEPVLASHDAFLVACFSEHPLVKTLQRHEHVVATGKPVTGIFEASVYFALHRTRVYERFGVISTGHEWHAPLTKGVEKMLRPEDTVRFIGVSTIGLSATELHEHDPAEVQRLLAEATRHLAGGRGGAGALILGCAGMSGMKSTIREALVECLGEEKGETVWVVDGVEAGVMNLRDILIAKPTA